MKKYLFVTSEGETQSPNGSDVENMQVIGIVDAVMNEDEGLKKAYLDASKHNWTKLELDAYDYVLMREQDERGRMTFVLNKSKKEIAVNLIELDISVEDTTQGTSLGTEQVQKANIKSECLDLS